MWLATPKTLHLWTDYEIIMRQLGLGKISSSTHPTKAQDSQTDKKTKQKNIILCLFVIILIIVIVVLCLFVHLGSLCGFLIDFQMRNVKYYFILRFWITQLSPSYYLLTACAISGHSSGPTSDLETD